MIRWMETVIMIPARMASSRFPNKPLFPLLGIAMIEHVYRRCLMVMDKESVFVATPDHEIMDTIQGLGGRAVMTSSSHLGCIDRVHEANEKIGASLIVIVQGDEPLLNPGAIHEVLRPSSGKDFFVSNLIQKIQSEEEIKSPNTVKVVVGENGKILYLSREKVPSSLKANVPVPYYKQIGLMAFSKEALRRYGEIKPTQIEMIESVDMIRFLEHGYPITAIETNHRFLGVDVPEDITQAEQALKIDPLTFQYLREEFTLHSPANQPKQFI